MRKFIVTSVAFDAQQNGWPKVFSPPDLCCSGSLELPTRGSYRTRRSRRAGRPLELRRVNQCPPGVLMQINVFRLQATNLSSRIRADGGKTCSQVITSQKDLSRR